MVTIYKTDVIKNTKEGKVLYGELRGLSTDEKPAVFEGKIIGNGSAFIEIDTQNIFFFDAESQEWWGK